VLVSAIIADVKAHMPIDRQQRRRPQRGFSRCRRVSFPEGMVFPGAPTGTSTLALLPYQAHREGSWRRHAAEVSVPVRSVPLTWLGSGLPPMDTSTLASR
jgi:hypothetical protein